jgi:3',5'-cyclic AMP phosphodiesterase CpdA
MKPWSRFRRAIAGAALAAALSVGGPASAAPSLVSGPYLTGLDDVSAVVRFELESSEPATLKVTPEGSGEAKARAIESPPSVMHAVHVGGLDPGTRYEYVVRVGTALLGGGHFTTAPAAGTSVRFLVYGDNRTDSAAHAAVVRAMSETPADFLVNTGDLVEEGGRRAQWKQFFEIEGPLLRNHALFAAIGNHELYHDDAGENYEGYFGFETADYSSRPSGPSGPSAHPYGTVAFGNVRFFFIDAMHDWDSGAERAWLERELAQTDDEADRPWRIAVMHHSPWSSGKHGPNTKLVGAHIPELLAVHKVDLVLAGHDHMYERGDAGLMKYIVTGGGGAPLYQPESRLPTARKLEASYHFVEISTDADALRVVAHRTDGTVIDRCGFGKGRSWDCDSPVPRLVLASTGPSNSSVRLVVTHEGALAGVASAAAPAGLTLVVVAGGLFAFRARSRRRPIVEEATPVTLRRRFRN